MKTVNLPDTVYDELSAVTDELALMAKKPLSLSMAVYLLTAIYRAYLSEPCARDSFKQRISHSDFLSPEEFEKECDNPIKKPPKARKQKQN